MRSWGWSPQDGISPLIRRESPEPPEDTLRRQIRKQAFSRHGQSAELGRWRAEHRACHEVGCGHAHALWIFLWAEEGKGAFLFSPATPEVNEFRLIFWILKRNFSVCNYSFYLAIIYTKHWVRCGRDSKKNKTHCALEGFTAPPGSQIPDKSTVCGGAGRWVPRVEGGGGMLGAVLGEWGQIVFT